MLLSHLRMTLHLQNKFFGKFTFEKLCNELDISGHFSKAILINLNKQYVFVYACQSCTPILSKQWNVWSPFWNCTAPKKVCFFQTNTNEWMKSELTGVMLSSRLKITWYLQNKYFGKITFEKFCNKISGHFSKAMYICKLTLYTDTFKTMDRRVAILKLHCTQKCLHSQTKGYAFNMFRNNTVLLE